MGRWTRFTSSSARGWRAVVIEQQVELELPRQVRARLLEALRDGDVLVIELLDFVLALHGRSKAVLRFEARPRQRTQLGSPHEIGVAHGHAHARPLVP